LYDSEFYYQTEISEFLQRGLEEREINHYFVWPYFFHEWSIHDKLLERLGLAPGTTGQ
jgi:hypothetical protein